MKKGKKKKIEDALLRIDANIPFSLSIVVSVVSSVIISVILASLLNNYVDNRNNIICIYIIIKIF